MLLRRYIKKYYYYYYYTLCYNGNNNTFIPFQKGNNELQISLKALRYKDHHLLRLGSGLLDIAMMRRPWVVGVEVPGQGIGEGRYGRAAGVGATGMVGDPWAASCSEDRHKGHDGVAATPGSAGSPRFAWTCR